MHVSSIVDGTEQPIMCWCAVKKLLTHTHCTKQLNLMLADVTGTRNRPEEVMKW